MLFMLDNFDSFTYNVVQYLQMLEQDVVVKRNDEISAAQVLEMKPQAIVLSPGPGRPESAGILLDLVHAAAKEKIPLLGICLGHQAIAQAFGAKIVHAMQVRHGKVSDIFHDGKGLFEGIASPLSAVRYHSLAVEKNSLPDCFEITAYTDDGEIMGIRHKTLPIESIQYHPESVMTPTGKRQLANFVRKACRHEAR